MASGARVAVVGGGLAGLSAAAFAARAGARVTLLERLRESGGRGRTRQEAGFLFNMGPHALYVGGPAMAALRELGIDPAGGAPPTNGGLAHLGGRLHALPGGFVSLLTTGLLGAGGKLELGKLLGGLARIDTAAESSVTLGDYLRRELRHEGVRQIAAAVVRLTSYANAPEVISAGAVLEQMRLGFGTGVRYLHGGWQVMVDELERCVRSLGVEIRHGARVEQVEHAESVRGVRLAGGEILPADAVVLALGPDEALPLVDDGQNAALGAAVKGCIPVRASCLDLGLSQLPLPKQASFALGIDRATYYSVHSRTARLAPDGAALIQVARYLAPGESPSREELDAEFDGLLDQLQPGWRAFVSARRLMRDLVVTHDLPHAARGGLPGRTPGPVPGIANLHLAGDWIGPDGLLADASLASGRAAGRAAASARRALAAA